MTAESLRFHYDQLQREATRLAGGLTDLSQRAAVYRHLFLASGGNHTFPLIAAHGALWAGGYFRFGLNLATALSWQYLGRPELRQRQLRKLAAFADVIRDINRRVCIDTYANFHFTRRFGGHPRATQFIPPELLEPLNHLHAACQQGAELAESEKRLIFEAHFRHEQGRVVGPALTNAVTEFDWPTVRALAVRPPVRFAYFPGPTRLWFRNFASQEERIEKGLAAFGLASEAGWPTVDAALKKYQVLPDAYFATPTAYFEELRATILSMA